MDYQKLPEDEDLDDINLDDIDIEDLLQEHTPKPIKKVEYKEISIGNGRNYYIDENNTTAIEKKHLTYPHVHVLIQIFIELRNALGYTSKPPHKFNIVQLAEVIKTLQIEYAKVYGILFCYGYKIIKADQTNPENNCRPFNILKDERLRASLSDTEIKLPPYPKLNIPPPSYTPIQTNHIQVKPAGDSNTCDISDGGDNNKAPQLDLSYLNKRRFGVGALKNNYTPLPQRTQRPKRDRYVSDDAKPVTSPPRIFGNQQVRRRKKTRIPVIQDAPY